MLPQVFPQTVTIISRSQSGVDSDGNPVASDGVSTDYPCRIERSANPREIVVGRDTRISNWDLFTPPEAVIGDLDRAVVDSVTYEVVGPPWLVWNGTAPDHLEVYMVLISG